MLDVSAEEVPAPAGNEPATADRIRRLREELDLLDRETAAAVLRVEPRTLDDWRQKRAGPPWVKIGGRVF
jgi:DNA-binding transcriptional regulator YiaG